MNPTHAENAVAAFLRFREEVKQAGLRLDDQAIVQLMVAERLNVIASNLDDLHCRMAEIVSRLA